MAGSIHSQPEHHALAEPATGGHDHLDDEGRLAELGYKQELKRGWGLLQNFGAAFSVISVVTGITTLFSYGLNVGGPAVMVWGWVVVSFFTFFVAMSMSEVVSAVPTSGGPYDWAARISRPENSAFAAWVTGWFNFLGQVAITTGISFGCAGLIGTLASNYGFVPTPNNTIGIFAALLISHAFVNVFGINVIGALNYTSIALHSLGVGSIAIAVVAAAPTHRTAGEVFGTFYDGTGLGDADGWSIRASPAYVAVCGILLAQYTITGYDASAHLAEETRNAAWAAPIGILMSVGLSAAFGLFLILCLLFSIQDMAGTIAAAQPVLQIFSDVFGETGATVLFSLIIVCVWHCGLFSLTANSRMMYAFARDGALPKYFNHVNEKLQTPIRTIFLAITLSFILALPSLGSSVAFAAATSIATIGLYISYGIPILILLIERKRFQPGPFSLGKYSTPVASVAVMWITFITIVFCLPTSNPVTSQTVNYTAVAVGILALWSLGSWYLWAKHWFKGPCARVHEEMGGTQSEQGESEKDVGEKGTGGGPVLEATLTT